ncbi:hypothetical protein BOX15_Mlig030048g1 [Macrostomum lignano]|uniref:Curli production assembly/transport component CsgE n=2 Tax=Macrostomum lignano TaxID=282301 RepID=A0A1I8HMS6_9PLAT|nr:hypothetical protein BOX15_Mlig030048g1 [Macrostomum lignano]
MLSVNGKSLIVLVALATTTICTAVPAEEEIAVSTTSFDATPSNSNPISHMALEIAEILKVSAPSGVICNSCLIKSWKKRDNEINHRQLPVSMIPSIVSQYPADMQQALMMGWMSSDMNWVDYHVNILKGDMKGNSRGIFVNNGIVDIVFMNVEIQAELVPKNRDHYTHEVNAIARTVQAEAVKVYREIA